MAARGAAKRIPTAAWATSNPHPPALRSKGRGIGHPRLIEGRLRQLRLPASWDDSVAPPARLLIDNALSPALAVDLRFGFSIDLSDLHERAPRWPDGMPYTVENELTQEGGLCEAEGRDNAGRSLHIAAER
jgi:hypothetical protein